MNPWRRYSWEIALAALLIFEILAFGLINPRLLDINVLLFSTSDFICIGIVALPLTMVIVSGGMDISFGSTIGLCAITLGVLFQLGMPLPLAIIITLLLGAICGLINAGLIIYTGVNPLVITLGTMYLFGGSALLLSGMAGATGYEGIGGFPTAFTDFANISFLGIPMPLIFFLCVLSVFLAAHASHAYGTQRFPDWPERPCRAVQRDPGESHVVYRVCHDRMRLRDRRRITGFLLWLRTFGSGRLFPDADHYGGCAGRRQYLWRLRVDYGVRVGGAAGGIFTAGATDGRSAESNFQRIVRCASHCCCRWSFRQFASSPNP